MLLNHERLELGKVLHDRYYLKHKLGENTVRQTWLAQDLQATDLKSSQVVIKLLYFSERIQREQIDLFDSRLQILQQLDCLFIPKYRDYFWIEDRYFWLGTVEDYISGNSLAKLLAEGKKFTEQEVKQIAIGTLNILIYLHEFQPPLLHKDIKPSNLIWGRDEHLYLINCGTVRNTVDRIGGTFTVVGTYGYTPIEQFGGKMLPASDLYALGATLIHLLTGIAPVDLPQKDLRFQLRDRVDVSPNLLAWLARITEPDLAKRLGSAEVALKSLISESSSPAVDARQNRFLPLPAREEVTKPSDTRVRLFATTDRLEIQLPMRGIKNLADGFRAMGCIGILAGFSSFFAIANQSMLALLLVILLAPFGIPAVVLAGFFFRSICRFFSHSVLILERDRAEVKKQVFGFIYRRSRCFTRSIQSISIGSTARSSQFATILITSKSDLKRHVRHSFGTSLSEAELVWLATEIRQWLHSVRELE